MPNKLQLKGKRFGLLMVLPEAGRDGQGNVTWLCICDCGKETTVRGNHLISNITKSCGCLIGKKETHGLSKSPEYHCWESIIQRCTNPNNSAFHNYGSRGITVCDRWLDFENFYADMGDRPEGLTIERVANDGDYEPSNCIWATRSTQQRNHRVSSKNKVGVTGISVNKENNKYRVRIRVGNQYIHLGYFHDLDIAIAERKIGESRYWGAQT